MKSKKQLPEKKFRIGQWIIGKPIPKSARYMPIEARKILSVDHETKTVGYYCPNTKGEKGKENNGVQICHIVPATRKQIFSAKKNGA